MQVSISLFDLWVAVLFVIGAAVGVYAIIALRGIQSAAREVTDFVRQHRAEGDKTVVHLVAAAENASVITSELRGSLGDAEKALQVISRNTTDTVLRVNETADQVATYM